MSLFRPSELWEINMTSNHIGLVLAVVVRIRHVI